MSEKLPKHPELTQIGPDYPKILTSDAINCNIRKFDTPPHLTRGGPIVPGFSLLFHLTYLEVEPDGNF